MNIEDIKTHRYSEWNDPIEHIIAAIGEKASCMSKLSNLASKYYDKQRTYLLVPASSISWSLNIFGMISTYFGPTVISEPLVILIVSIGNFVTATLTTVAEKSKAGDKVELFNQASKDYYLLYSEISTQLSFERQLRETPYQFFKSCMDRYNLLLQSNPNLPDKVLDDFRYNCKDYDIVHPDHITVQKVFIYREPNQNMKSIDDDVFDDAVKKKWKKINIVKDDIVKDDIKIVIEDNSDEEDNSEEEENNSEEDD